MAKKLKSLKLPKYFVPLILLVSGVAIGYVGKWLQDRPPTPISNQQLNAIKETLYSQFGERMNWMNCGPKHDTPEAKNIFFKDVKVNRTGDRAIYGHCGQGEGELVAKAKNGKWFPVFSIDAAGDQDYRTRVACNIEDITTGYNETREAYSPDTAIAICHKLNELYKAGGLDKLSL